MRSGIKRVAGIAVTVLSVFLVVPLPAQATPSDDEAGFIVKINELRSSRGLSLLAPDTRLRDSARLWAQQMATNGGISHDPNLAGSAPAGWRKIGENVGVGSSVLSLHQAFVNSPAHYANLIDPQYKSVGVAVVYSGGRMWVVERFMDGTPPPAAPVELVTNWPNYRLLAADGGLFGGASFHGSTGGMRLNSPVVGMAITPSNAGYWMVAADGGVFSFGDAVFQGSTGNIRLNQSIVGMTKTPSGNGYWIVAADGGIFSYGDARFLGSTGAIRLNSPIVGMASTPSGNGYWLAAADGGIFAFGDAAFYGSTGGTRLNSSIADVESTPSGRGYWLVARDGGIFAFGDAVFYGSTGAIRLNSPIVGMASTSSGNGYWLAAADGGIFAFGNAPFNGSAGGSQLNQPIVGIAH